MTGPPQTSSPRRSGVREVAVAFAATLLLTAAFDLMGRSAPFVRANLVTLVAAVFLWIPTVTLPRNGPGTEAYGLTFRGAVNGLRWGLGISLLTFVLFLPANHWWNTRVVGLEFAPDVGAYVHLPDRWYGGPAEPEPGVVHVLLAAARSRASSVHAVKPMPPAATRPAARRDPVRGAGPSNGWR